MISKKNFQTYVYFICLIAVVQASIILNVKIKKTNIKYYKIAAMINTACFIEICDAACLFF